MWGRERDTERERGRERERGKRRGRGRDRAGNYGWLKLFSPSHLMPSTNGEHTLERACLEEAGNEVFSLGHIKVQMPIYIFE